MAEGRGGAVVVVAVLVLLMVSLQCEVAHATDTLVGDTKGWTQNVTGWEKGKKFSVGETLAFHYTKGKHNVVVVNKAGYDTCKAGPKDVVHASGNDIIPLIKGDNYFICNFTGHCASMKIKVTAS